MAKASTVINAVIRIPIISNVNKESDTEQKPSDPYNGRDGLALDRLVILAAAIFRAVQTQQRATVYCSGMSQPARGVMELRELDLNLLLVFNQLLIDRRVSTAADNLELTQPAVSNALKRLRSALNDELFVRTYQGMEPTPYAGSWLSRLRKPFKHCAMHLADRTRLTRLIAIEDSPWP